MNLPVISLVALGVVIFLSALPRVNVGAVALSLAWIIGYYLAGIPIHDILHGFPFSIFIVLFGITFLFGLARINGTLDKFAHIAVVCVKGNRRVIPVIFFFLALGLSSIGPGNIGAVALLAPMAMAVARKTGISAFLMTIMLVNGANAGTFSPLALTGIIANGLINQIGLSMNPITQVYLPSLIAQTFIAFVSYFVFQYSFRKQSSPNIKFDLENIEGEIFPWTKEQVLTLAVIALLILGVVFGKADVGFLAISLAVILILFGKADSEEAIKLIPWNTIMMVCGVSTLISILETTGGLNLFTSLLAGISSQENLTGILALIVGIVSSFSSSSGVVLPAFLPVVPELIEKMGGGNPVAIISTINVASHVVDVSPLSTLGALCVASAASFENRGRFFRKLLIYGLAMSFFGALVCQLFFGTWAGIFLK